MSKKMTRIESARTVRDFKGNCGANYDIQCRKCFNYLPKTNKCKSNSDTERLIAAQIFIERHNQKSKRKPKPVSAKTAPTRDTEEEFWKFVLYGTSYSDRCAGQRSRGYCDDRCPYNDENGLCPYEHETISSMNEYAENFFKKDTRPNFRQALKDKKEFYVAVTPELSEELQKVAFECGAKWMGNPDLIQVTGDFLIFEFSVAKQNAYHIYASNIIIDHKAEHTEYDPTTDTFKEPVSIGTVPDVEWFECIDIGGVSGKNLSYRKKYKVIGRDDDMVTIVNDKGKEERVWASRFIPATDTFKEPIPKEIIGNPSDKADELPEPIKFEDEVPEYVYFLDDDSMIRFKVVELKMKHTKYPSGKEDKEILLYVERDVGNSYIPMVDCYRTLDEAVKIFKSKEVSQ